MDDTPLDEYALDFLDEIHPDAKRLIKQMLAAAVEYPNVHSNALSITRTREGDYDYFLGRHGGRTSPLQNHQRMPVYLRDTLVHHGILGPKINPQWTDSVSSFTKKALEWHRAYGGPNPDAIRRLVGRVVRRDSANPDAWFDAAAVAIEFNVPEANIREQARILVGTRHIVEERDRPGNFGILRFTNPKGELWAEQGFPSIHGENLVQVEVSVAVTVNNIIEQAREKPIPAETLLQFEALMRRAQEELEKPRGQGSFERVSELMTFAANVKELAPLVGSFLSEHGDKIQGLADAAGNILPG
jgi:hypothetical protein